MRNLTISLILIMLSGCMAKNDSIHNEDPYESINKPIFKFNRKFDTAILKPIALSYKTITPKPLSKCISHAFLNLSEINTIANDLLQLRVIFALEDLWRLAINSTLGIGGCVDIADKFDLPRRSQSFAFTLKTWGVKKGSFIIIPFIGASTTTNMFGLPLKYYTFDPVRFLDNYQAAVQTLRIVDKKVQLLPLDAALANAFDPYVLYKNAYQQTIENNYKELSTN